MSYQKGAFCEKVIPEEYCKGCSESQSKNVSILHHPLTPALFPHYLFAPPHPLVPAPKYLAGK